MRFWSSGSGSPQGRYQRTPGLIWDSRLAGWLSGLIEGLPSRKTNITTI